MALMSGLRIENNLYRSILKSFLNKTRKQPESAFKGPFPHEINKCDYAVGATTFSIATLSIMTV